jgi:Ca-activated chloride channel family protein
MRLATPEFLLLFLLLPAAWALRAWWNRRQGREVAPTFSYANFVALARSPGGVRAALASALPGLRVLAVAALIVALARPQTEDWETLTGTGLDIMICLDMSGSMNAVDMDADEIAETQSRGEEPSNRFRTAVNTLKQFVANRKGDRVGLVAFSSEAYLKFPLTLDYETIARQLDSLVLDNMERDRDRPGCINDCTIGGEKTAIGDALAKAYKRLERSDGKGKIIVLITDGNDNASKLKPLDVAKYVGDQPDSTRPRLYAFLVGGGPKSKIPYLQGGRLLRQLGFLTYTPYEESVDEEKIREMVETARGIFHVAYDEEQFRKSFAGLETSEQLERKVARHKELFLPVLLLALALLGLELFVHATVLRRYP